MSHSSRRALEGVVAPDRTFGAVRRVLGTLRDAAVSAWKPRASAERSWAFHYERVLGTSLELQVAATDAECARAAESIVLTELDRLEQILSGYSATSELSRWQEQHNVAIPVSPELADVLIAAEVWRVRTGGAFNPAAVSLVALLSDPVAPGADDVVRRREIREHIHAMRQPLWTVNRASGVACRLTSLPISLDAIAKGYIVDRVTLAAAASRGITQVLVNIGGDLRHVGSRPVVVGVADPRAPSENAAPVSRVHLRGAALATSGGYRRGFTMDGGEVSHIIDPRTARPADHVISASVIAPDCATADALSTAFSVLAPEESVALADTLDDVGCLLVGCDGTITMNATWRRCAVA